ncbi:hypothetical protein LCGC14_0541180 [marine sediment metagenome]|uniref:Uncharacterized protein n=1 Tax=marine sediment metagenome TaxID=412755 RepID=A0A0F9RXE3_9ZZZZ
MNRSAYTNCMIPFMKGGGPDRKLRFCIGAKVCSGKAQTEAEAKQICVNQPAKEPKPRKSSGRGRGVDPVQLAGCISANMDLANLTRENLPTRLEAAITHCKAGKSSAKPLTYKRFMSSCIKETSEGGDFIHSQPDIKRCQTKWNAMRGS